MITKTKLAEDMEFIVREIENIRGVVNNQERKDKLSSENTEQLIVYVESLISILIKKGIFTKEEFSVEVAENKSFMQSRSNEIKNNVKLLAARNYLNWLLTKSKNVGHS